MVKGGTSATWGICESLISHCISTRTRYRISPYSLMNGANSLTNSQYLPSNGDKAVNFDSSNTLESFVSVGVVICLMTERRVCFSGGLWIGKWACVGGREVKVLLGEEEREYEGGIVV